MIFYATPQDHQGCHDNQASQLTPTQPLVREHTCSFIESSTIEVILCEGIYIYIQHPGLASYSPSSSSLATGHALHTTSTWIGRGDISLMLTSDHPQRIYQFRMITHTLCRVPDCHCLCNGNTTAPHRLRMKVDGVSMLWNMLT